MCGGGNPISGALGATKQHIDDTLASYRQDPERPILGINTPFEGNLWGNVTGKDYSPTITNSGGPTEGTFSKAQAKGYDTSLAEGVHWAAPYFVGAMLGARAGGVGPTSGTQGSEQLVGGAGADTAAGASGTYYGDIPVDPALQGTPSAASSYDPNVVSPDAARAMGIQPSYQMPAATPEADPTFGGQLTQTGAGTYERFPGMSYASNAPSGPSQPSAARQTGTTQQNQAQQQPAAQPGGQQTQTANAPAQQTGSQNADQSFVDRVLAQMKNNPMATVGLGMTAASMAAAGQQKRQQPQSVQQAGEISSEAKAAAQQLLAQYRSGQVSPGQQATLDESARNARNQINQYFASIGQADSTAHRQALAQVDQQSLQMKQQMLDSALQNGMSALGIASGPLQNVIQYELGQDKALRDAFANFAGQMGNFGGRQAGTQPAPRPQDGQPTQVVQSNQPPS